MVSTKKIIPSVNNGWQDCTQDKSNTNAADHPEIKRNTNFRMKMKMTETNDQYLTNDNFGLNDCFSETFQPNLIKSGPLNQVHFRGRSRVQLG